MSGRDVIHHADDRIDRVLDTIDRIARPLLQAVLVAAVMYIGTHVALAQPSLLDAVLVMAVSVALAIVVALVVDHEAVAA